MVAAGVETECYRLPVSSPLLCFLASTMSSSSCLMLLPPEAGVVPWPCLSHYDKLSHLKIELKLFFLNLSLFQHSEEWDSELLALMWSVGELQWFTRGGKSGNPTLFLVLQWGYFSLLT